jgi:septal ring factor EnvC (AmiA/AmiB activator)
VRRNRDAKLAEISRLASETGAARTSLAEAIRQRRRLLDGIREQSGQRRAALTELERASRELTAILAGQTAPHPVKLDVLQFKGLLPMPSAGPVTRVFGDVRDPRLGAVLPHRGWDIGARYGGDVRAVFDGKIVWASWFRGYGLMVVIDHGRGIHSVYAHLSAIIVSVGAEIEQGQVLGHVGDTGSLAGPTLYFEMRRAGRAEDPAVWVRRSQADRGA